MAKEGNMRKAWLIVLTALAGTSAFAHGGGLDASGCHNDRKRGGYHCHGGGRKTSSFLSTPAKRKKVVAKAKNGVRTARTLFGNSDVYFANCSQARAAGAAPVRAGSPGYARRLDRDGDGVGCE